MNTDTNKNFRLQTNKLFITYSQTNEINQELLNFLHSKLDINKYIVCKEHHKDKGKHHHIYLELNNRCDIKNPRFLDYRNHHPKMEKARSGAKCMNYCKKDNDYITNMKFDTFERARILAKSGAWQQALHLIIEEQPKEIKYLDKWETNLKRYAKLCRKPSEHIKKFTKEDFKPYNLKWDKNTTLVLQGKSGIGKTQYAKTLFKNPLIVRHMDKLKQFDELIHDGIIFDDINLSHYPREPVISILDIEEDSDINVKCGMITLPPFTPRVITTNRQVRDIFPCFDKAIRRRISINIISTDIRKRPRKSDCNVNNHFCLNPLNP